MSGRCTLTMQDPSPLEHLQIEDQLGSVELNDRLRETLNLSVRLLVDQVLESTASVRILPAQYIRTPYKEKEIKN